jgi:uncharacterized membrane protein YqgA involved in biofilm formation
VRGLGTLVNIVAVLGGTIIGLLVGIRFPERLRTTVLQAVGLTVVALGISQAIGTRNFVFPLAAIVLGGIVGELLGIEDRLEAMGERIRRRFERERPDDAHPSTFVEGFVTASLLYCVGPLAILGSISDGLGRGSQLLVVKAALDGFVSIILASTLGIGVAFSVIPLLILQGTITAGAGAADHALTARMITEMTATGGLMVLGIGIRLLDLKPVRVGSFLPALVIAPLAVRLFAR